ncbi:ribonuclease H-like domain-containing protein [Mycena galopus ATCC 62051]|nr:ribonuclease H-like domain-containing protein [Mycena galopus ATCC 62051]
MLRAFISQRIPTLVTRLRSPVALSGLRQDRRAGNFTSATNAPDLAPPLAVEPHVLNVDKSSTDSSPTVTQSSFADVLKEMVDSDPRPQNSERWPRPALPRFDASVDLATLMFGVTQDGNSVCVRVNEGTASGSETKISGMSWLKVSATRYISVSELDRHSHCQLELAAEWADIEIHSFEEATPPPPLRVLSFDIECLGREGTFPTPEVDPVIQIGNVVSIHGSPAPPTIRNVFTLGTCSPIPGAHVISHNAETTMLQNWSDFVREVDPDVIIGYNIAGFDLPYLLARAKTLEVPRFPFLGRLKEMETASARTIKYTIREHARSWEDIPVLGRLQLDLMQYVRCETDQRAISLNAVAKRFLAEKKEDIHFTAIAGLQTGSADTRQQLAVYCLKDAYLPQRLLEVLGCVEKYTAVVQEKRIQFNSILPDHKPVQTTGSEIPPPPRTADSQIPVQSIDTVPN